jgi:hypothetical protein
MKPLDLDYGEAIILPFREKYKMIIRKETDGLFYFVHPVTLEKLAFNQSGILILIQFLLGQSKEDVADLFAEQLKIPAGKSLEWVTDFEIYIRKLELIG